MAKRYRTILVVEDEATFSAIIARDHGQPPDSIPGLRLIWWEKS
jgi:hypothetical protein